jgi:hypothetical protein
MLAALLLTPAPGGALNKALSDNAVGTDVLSTVAYIDMSDDAVGTDTLTRSFLLPPITDFPTFDTRDIFSPDQLPVATDVDDAATGSDLLAITAFTPMADQAVGEDTLTVEKHYPQLAAFTWLLAA